MSINEPYKGVQEMPSVLAVFPLAGALLLPRGELPLNIFEPRYLAMVDDAMRRERLIGLIQPWPNAQGDKPRLCHVGCAGRITQLAETGNGRYVLTLSGVGRFRCEEELSVTTPYRQCRADFTPYASDFEESVDDEEVDRAGVLRTLREFAEANNLRVDWKSVEAAPNEALVNALSMMSPFGPKEKQALLEAETLKIRADVLIAITELELARVDGAPSSLQ